MNELEKLDIECEKTMEKHGTLKPDVFQHAVNIIDQTRICLESGFKHSEIDQILNKYE